MADLRFGGEPVAAALHNVFISTNEADRNLEPANVVDGLFAIARALDRVAEAVNGVAGQIALHDSSAKTE